MLTAARTAALAAELGIPHVLAVGNKARTTQDAEFLRSALGAEGIPVAGILPYDLDVAAADRAGTVQLMAVAPSVRSELEAVLDAVDAAGRS